jgi:hypothetical protein
MCGNSLVHQAFDLLAVSDIRLNNCIVWKAQLFRQRPQPVDPSGTKNELRALLGEVASRRLAEAAARTRDDDDFTVDVLRHGCSPI